MAEPPAVLTMAASRRGKAREAGPAWAPSKCPSGGSSEAVARQSLLPADSAMWQLRGRLPTEARHFADDARRTRLSHSGDALLVSNLTKTANAAVGQLCGGPAPRAFSGGKHVCMDVFSIKRRGWRLTPGTFRDFARSMAPHGSPSLWPSAELSFADVGFLLPCAHRKLPPSTVGPPIL